MVVVACGDDDDNDASDDDIAASIDAEGCEPGEVSGGDRPTEAPDMPEDTEAALATAIDDTKALTSAVTAWEVNAELPGGNTVVDIEAAFDTEGPVWSAFVQGVNDEDASGVFCSDGETTWLHLDHPDIDEALPSGTAWVTGPGEEMFGTGLLRDPETIWDVFAILRGLEDATDDGTDEVEGVPVRMIEGTVDYEAALTAASEEEAASMASIVAAGDPAPAITAEVGLDSDGVLRSLDLEVSGEDDEGDRTIDVEIEVREANPAIGEPTKPAEDQTVELADVPEVENMLRGG
jgi:hypothetical protein